MIERPVATFALSLLTVFAAALILYRPDPAPEAEPTEAVATGPPPPRPTAAEPWPEGRDPSPPPSEPVRPDDRVSPVAERRATASRPRRRARTLDDSAFVVVEPGETLADVAARALGTTASVEDLWLANRDLLPRVDSPLKEGMVLRAPRRRRMTDDK